MEPVRASSYAGTAPQTYGEGRTCSECGCRLSRYNPDPTCSTCTGPDHRIMRMTGRLAGPRKRDAERIRRAVEEDRLEREATG
jgi:predicted  nucleic acid-binding Zn-ribbon protein